jgi:plastocyanin
MTTVQVGMFEYRFDLSQTSVPSGQVTFVITNKGQEVHNFSVAGFRAGTLLSPGGTETYTIAMPPGTYTYVCDVPFHAERGMTGVLTVTP